MKKSVHIVSTSFAEFDRRLLRIKGSLEKSGMNVIWHCRKINPNSTVDSRRVNPIFKSGILFYIEFNIRLFLILLRSSSSIYYAVDLDTLLAVFLAAKIRSKPFLFDSHEYYTEVPELQGKRFKKAIWESLAKWIIPRSKHNITVNQSLAALFKDLYRVPFQVIRNAPTSEVVSRSKNRNECTLLYQGAINQGRGLEIAIEAIKSLPKYQLILVGDGDILKDLKEMVKENNLENRVHFKGWVKPNELAKYTDQAWLGINMLDPISQNYTYSLANKFFDYIHSGLPSINMAFPEYTLINNRFPVSYLCETYSKESLLSGIKYYENMKMYKHSVDYCSKAKLAFNWEKEEQRLLHFMNEIR